MSRDQLTLTLTEEELAQEANATASSPRKKHKGLRVCFPVDMAWLSVLSPSAIQLWLAVGTAWRLRRDTRIPLPLSSEVIRWSGQHSRTARRNLEELRGWGLVEADQTRGRKTRIIWVDIFCRTPPPLAVGHSAPNGGGAHGCGSVFSIGSRPVR